jgi:F-type H+-transporting ATPase subunit gamma
LANLKIIRKRISSVKSTQKITRAMKMVAGARLNRAQQRITALRPYAVKTGEVLRQVTAAARERVEAGASAEELSHPLLAQRPEKKTLLIVVTSDRGLCGAFNTNINRFAERLWRDADATGRTVQFAIVGRKGRDYLRRRKAPIHHVFDNVWDRLGLDEARNIASTALKPFVAGEFDAIYIVYNEFKSAMTQRVVAEPLFPLGPAIERATTDDAREMTSTASEYIFEPTREALLERLVPMYVEISILRALYESMASELGARMTAMDSATKNAADMIERLTLEYNRARQAAITTELMEIIGGANALQE